MSSRRRWMVAAFAMCIALGGDIRILAQSAPPAAALDARAVRSLDATIVHVIRIGRDRSATFSRIVGQIEKTDGLVYIVPGACSHGVHACLLLRVTIAGPRRILRVVVDVRHQGERALLMSIGHELQHVVELLSDDSIRTDSQAFLLFQRIGMLSADRFETSAAIHAANQIREEFDHSSDRLGADTDVNATDLPHVRTGSAAIRRLVDLGLERSATFRHVVGRIEDSDSIIYMDEGTCSHGVRACLLMHVTMAGPYRVLRVLLDLRGRRDVDAVQSVAHELQHTIEVIDDPSIRTDARLFSFFDRKGFPWSNRFETEDAVQVGSDVRTEFERAGD